MKSSMWLKNGFIYLIIIVAVVAIIFTIIPSLGGTPQPSINEVINLAKQKQIKEIIVQGDDLTLIRNDGKEISARKEEGTSIYEILRDAEVDIGPNGVKITPKGSSGFSNVFGILINFLPLIFFGALLIFMMRQAQGSNNQTLGFGRSKAKVFLMNRPTVTFEDVAGAEEPKQELQEVVEFLKYPERFLSLGARIPKGILMVGPPGTGKTLLARAVSGETGVPFFSISGSEFVEMFVGVGAARVRDLFEQAKRNSPCIVFVDEIDAVGRHRGAGLGGGHDEREQTLNQILVEMDGFEPNVNIIVIAATNRPDILDPALLRPGRFDRRVVLDHPDIKGRKAILEVHSKGKPLAPDVDMDIIGKLTPGFSGADLANLVNEAAILAARHGLKSTGMAQFQEAIDRVIAGPERKSRVINKREKEITAYHEAGHALVAWTLPNADPPHKVSIVSRGNMGGYTRMLPEEDRYLWTKAQFEDLIATALGGRAAEDLIYSEVTTGPSNDLEQATRVARQMVTRYSMSFTTDSEYEQIPISTVLEWANMGKLEKIEVFGSDLLIYAKNKARYRSRKETDTSIAELLHRAVENTGNNGVKIEVGKASGLDRLGPRVYGKREELVFLGKEISEERDYSNETAKLIDEEVNNLITRAYERARKVLRTNKSKLVEISKYLIMNETVEAEGLKKLFSSPVSEESAVTVDTGLPESSTQSSPPASADQGKNPKSQGQEDVSGPSSSASPAMPSTNETPNEKVEGVN